MTVADLEREIIERVLEDQAGNKIRAAQLVYYPGARSAWQSGLREAVGQAARDAKS